MAVTMQLFLCESVQNDSFISCVAFWYSCTTNCYGESCSLSIAAIVYFYLLRHNYNPVCNISSALILLFIFKTE